MGFQAVLDADVLLPAPLRDTLLRLAEADLYVPRWSERILAEVAKNLVQSGRTDRERATRVTATIAAAFPEAIVSKSVVSTIEPAMTNDPKDRHVLAAAVGAGGEIVVTKNLGDFPPAACDPLGIQAVSPDGFLVDLYHVDRAAALRALVDQAAALTNPALTLPEVLNHIGRDAPEFAGLIREDLSQR